MTALDPEDGGIMDFTKIATEEDIRRAIGVIGGNARYGGLLNCTLAGMISERARIVEFLRQGRLECPLGGDCEHTTRYGCVALQIEQEGERSAD